MRLLLGDSGDDCENAGGNTCGNSRNTYCSPGIHGETYLNTTAQLATTQQGATDLMLVQSWIRELIEGEEGVRIASKFHEEEIDVEALAEFNQDELMKYGVHKVGWQKKLMGRARKEYVARSSGTTGRLPNCCVCLHDHAANVAMGPCGHVCVCSGCADENQLSECPICQDAIQYKLKIFLS